MDNTEISEVITIDGIKLHISNNIIDAIRKVYDWQYQNTDSFYNLLFTLFQKADAVNRAKLQSAFFYEWVAFQQWNNADEFGDALFKKYRIGKFA